MINIKPPYYAVIFPSELSEDIEGYGEMADKIEKLAKAQPGFLGFESARNSDGFGISVSYWQDLDAIRNWQQNLEHKAAKSLGKSKWYKAYKVRIAKVEYEY